jgi:hypothetical protein
MKAFEARKRALLSCTKGAGAFLTFSPKIRLSAIVGGERSARRFGAIFLPLPEGMASPSQAIRACRLRFHSRHLTLHFHLGLQALDVAEN